MHNYRAFLLTTSVAALLGVAAPAAAQGSLPPRTEPAAGNTQVEELVVTGSRIRRSEFTSASPLTVITTEQASAEGVINTSEILQGSTTAVSARQIDNEFTGFVVAGGPGVNSVSLRGLGAQRTLILLNGKRVSPAGTRGQVGAVDLNTLPGTIIDRIDILKDGASSIYGSDAVAGVINILTQEKLDGFELEASGNLTQHGGGEQYRIGGSWGKTWERGYFNVSAERFKQFSMTVGQRPDTACAQDYVYRPDGSRFDVTYPNGDFICVGSASGVYTRNADTARFVYDPTSVQNGSTDPNLAINLNGYRRVNMTYTNLVPSNAAVRAGYNAALFPTACPTTAGNADLTSPTCIAARIAYARASQAAYPQDDPIARDTTAISPATRTSVYFTGGYEFSDNLETYGELLLNRRESSQSRVAQIFNNVTTANPTNPFPFTARTTLLVPRTDDQKVDYLRAVGGFKGKFDAFGQNYAWDIFAVHGRSDAEYGGDFAYADRVNAIINLTRNPDGSINCPANLITVSDGGSNPTVRDGTQACVPVNVFRPDLVVPNGGSLFTQAERDFLFGYEVGKTKYTQTIVEGTIDGTVWELPAGPVGAALGFHWRRDEIDDVPGFNARNNNFSAQTTAGITRGSDTVKELFGETEIPLLRDLPFIKLLEVNGSYRWSDYKSYGQNDTYKVGLNWQVFDWMRFRATQGTSFRAPALYEMFLANQSGFQSQLLVDPCINTSASSNTVLQANCDAALRAVGVPEDRLRTFTAPGGGAVVLTGGGGKGILEPERSKAQTIGVIFTPSFIDLRVAVDYSFIEVKDQVAQFGATNIPLFCYRATDFPNNQFCQLFTRQTDPTQSNFRGIATINNSYVNIANQRYRALDLTSQYNHDFGWARMRFDLTASWALGRKSQTLGQPVLDFNGEVYTPDFVATGFFRFDRGPWRLTYTFDFVGKASDSERFPDAANSTSRGPNPTTPGLPIELVERFSYVNNVPFTDYHHISLRYRFDDNTLLTVGMRNVFDERPPVYSSSGNGAVSRIGSAVLSSQYDLIGRRMFAEINKKF